ncbi:hypothetical protein KR009_009545, partial [Drosophila setifemur]
NFVQLLEMAIAKCLKSYASYKEDLARAYILLAAHFTRLAYKEVGNRRTALQAKVTNLLQVLDGMQRTSDRQLLVIRGFAFMLTASRATDADGHFANVLRQLSSSVPALIGRACLAYNRQDYAVALGYFKSVLMHQPRGPADVRVGIAHCFLKLGELDKARRSFELALEHNGRSQNALLGMALLKLNQVRKETHREGINLLCAAYELNNRHSAILGVLANHYYYAKDHEKVWALAGNAYLLTDIPQMQAENCFRIARSFHATGQFDKATDFYQLSVRLAPDGYVLPQFGLAQMHLRRGKQSEAKACLETMLKVLPNQHCALRLLSKIYLAERAKGQVDQAIEMLVKVVEDSSGRQDYDSWLTLALAYEQKQVWKLAIDAYQQAIRIYTKLGQVAPVEWLNNLASVHFLAKSPQQALKTIDGALALAQKENQETNRLTLRFNRSRILEDLHRCDLAEMAYKDILREYPSYYDCYIRLGVMALRQNKFSAAIEYFKDVLKVDNDSLAARSYLGNCYMKLGLTTQAMYNHNVILRSSRKPRDPYTMVAVGNVCLKNIQRSMAKGDSPAAKRHQEKALHFYKKALERNPSDLWAANGIGAALGSREHLPHAEMVFREILDTSNVCPPAILNSAHMALEMGENKKAIQLYRRCLDDFLPKNCVEVMLALAKALYQNGGTGQAKMLLIKALHVAPGNPLVIYNLALVIKADSEQVFGQKRAKLSALKRAERELNVASRYFDYMSTCLAQSKVSPRAAAKQAKNCKILLANLPEELQRAGQQEALDENRIRMQEQRHQQHLQQLDQQRIQREEDERILRMQQFARRQEVLERTKKILINPQERGKGRGRGRKNQPDHRDEGEPHSNDEQMEIHPMKSRKRCAVREKKRPKKTKTKEFLDSTDDSEL